MKLNLDMVQTPTRPVLSSVHIGDELNVHKTILLASYRERFETRPGRI